MEGHADTHTLTDMHTAPAEGSFCDEHGNVLKSTIIDDYK
jgi:hypothetical protein